MSVNMATSQISVRFPDRVLDRIEVIARQRSIAVASVVKEAVDAYLSRQSRGLMTQDPSVQAAARTAKQIRSMQNELHVAMAFLDMLVRTYLLHTPPVPEDALDAQAAAAEQRYRKLIEQLPLLLQSGDGLAGVSEALVSSVSGDAPMPR